MEYPFRIEEVTEELVLSFLNGDNSETDLFDFKEILYPLREKSEKKSFLKDIVSMMNSKGGIIIIGVSDNGEEIKGIPSDFDLDNYKRICTQLLTSSIEPHVSGVLFKIINFREGNVLIIIVPVGDARPYCIRFQSEVSMEFFERHDGSNHPMKYSAVKQMMLGGALHERVAQEWQEWREKKLIEIAQDKWEQKLERKACIVIILNPLSTKPSDEIIPMTILKTAIEKVNTLIPPASQSWTNVACKDGYYAVGRKDGDFGQGNPCYSFAACNKNGSLVFYDSVRMGHYQSAGRLNQEIDNYFNTYVSRASKHLVEAGQVGKKYEVTVNFLKGKGLKIPPKFTMPGSTNTSRGIPDDFYSIKCDLVIGEDTILALRPLMDELWQVSGFDRCFRYDENGNHIGGLHEEP